jgi:nodulation protein E
MKRVVITGQGTINALGHDVPETLQAMARGTPGIANMDFADIDRLAVTIGAQVRGFSPERHFSAQQLSLYDPFTRFAMVAADQAMQQSGLQPYGKLSERAGVILGTAGGGLQTQDENYRKVYQDGRNRVHPFVVPRLMNNAATSHIAMAYDLRGPSYTVSTACASSNHAMGQAFHMIRAGLSPVMLTGGSESMLCFGGLKAWEGLRVMSPDGCRPFCKQRNGMVQGEGAAIFVFEELGHARKRGAEILAEVAGFAMNSDASDIVMPDVNGAARAILGTLTDARLNRQEVGYINAHGTGTTANDKTECAAIRQVFGAHADRLMVSSTKSMHGHLIGGTGAVELLAAIAAVGHQFIAPTIGYREPDPECNLDVVPNEARDSAVDVALSTAFAFGGLNAVLAIRRY